MSLPTELSGRKVQVVLIHHRHGTNTYVCSTPTKAQEVVRSFVAEYWHEVEDDAGTMPTNFEEAIDTYFEQQSDMESYEITEVTIDGDET